jgi:MFS family permease
MARIPRYRLVGTLAMGVMVAGLVLLSRVGLGTSRWEITRDIVIIGAGLGVSFPLTIAVVQAGVPRRWLGVATSQVNFWRSLGGAIGTAVLGSVLTNRLPQHGLANSLDFLFLIAAGVAVVAVIATLFMREVPLGQASEAGAEREGFEVAAAA